MLSIMLSRYGNVIGFFFLLMLFSCENPVFDSKKELLEFMENKENGLTYYKHVNGVDFKLTYRPTDILVDQELKNFNDKSERKKLRKKYSSFIYFNLMMAKNGQELLTHKVNDKTNFTKLISELSFELDDKLYLYSAKKDTIALSDYSYPRMYGTTGSTNILLVYPRNEKLLANDFFMLAISDLGFSTGEVRFKINVEPILNQPELNFDIRE